LALKSLLRAGGQWLASDNIFHRLFDAPVEHRPAFMAAHRQFRFQLFYFKSPAASA
jgi:hypothetical protein